MLSRTRYRTCVLFASLTVMGRAWRVLIVPRFQRAIHALDYVFALVMFVMEVVGGHG